MISSRIRIESCALTSIVPTLTGKITRQVFRLLRPAVVVLLQCNGFHPHLPCTALGRCSIQRIVKVLKRSQCSQRCSTQRGRLNDKQCALLVSRAVQAEPLTAHRVTRHKEDGWSAGDGSTLQDLGLLYKSASILADVIMLAMVAKRQAHWLKRSPMHVGFTVLQQSIIIGCALVGHTCERVNLNWLDCDVP